MLGLMKFARLIGRNHAVASRSATCKCTPSTNTSLSMRSKAAAAATVGRHTLGGISETQAHLPPGLSNRWTSVAIERTS